MKKTIAWVLVAALIFPFAPVQGEDFVVSQEETVLAEPETEILDDTSTTTPEYVEETATTTPTDLVSTETPVTADVVSIEESSEVPEGPWSGEQVIIKLGDTSEETLEAIEEAEGVMITDILADDTIVVVASSSAEAAAEILEDFPSVEYAEASVERTPFAIPTNDTNRALLWALENTGQTVSGVTGTAGSDIDAVNAWNLSYGTSTTIAVIDSGVMYTHPDLEDNMWDGTSCKDSSGNSLGSCVHGYDFADNDLDPFPIAASSSPSHGTHVAGTAAAVGNNNIGVVGVAPSATIMALRFNFTTATEIQAIDFARENGVRIINASYGGTTYSQGEYDAIKRFTDAGGLFIAAAGNSGDDSDEDPIFPAAYDLPGIISVAATNQNDALTSFTNFGAITVDIGAPGDNILSSYFSSTSQATYAYADGTSMAAPHVSGVAALIKSLYPDLTAAEIKTAILAGGDALPALSGQMVSGKRLNAYGALLAANADTDPPVITLNGAATLSLTVGDTYTELGATAFDTRDGTTTVTVGGDTVNDAAAGTYTVTYDSSDAAGNHATQVVRTVSVASAPVVSSGGGGGGGGGGGKKKSSDKKKSSSKSSKSKSTSTKTTAKTTTSKKASTGIVAGVSTSAPATTMQPVAIPATTFVSQLTLGSTGTEVTALQNALTRSGLYFGPVTGYFGPMTQAAVRAYQARLGLAQVGFLGPMTRAALNSGR